MNAIDRQDVADDEHRSWLEYVADREAKEASETDRLKRAHPAEWREYRRVAPLLDLSEVEPCEWGFADFLAAVGPRPSSRHRVGRRRKRYGYAPDNLRWVERSARNKKYLTYREVLQNYPLTKTALYALKDQGRITYVKDKGVGFRFLRADLDRYVREHTAPAVQPALPKRSPPRRRESAPIPANLRLDD